MKESMAHIEGDCTIALVGNPNCGKTTLFNRLTGSNQSVGNWPGVTVEKKVGKIRLEGGQLQIIDLPGIYSLSACSIEEVIAREYIESDEPDVIINIIDAANIERNLFLSTQLMEIGKPIVLALNMMDMLEARGESINVHGLEEELGVPVVPITASKGLGMELLLKKTLAQYGKHCPLPALYTQKLAHHITAIEEILTLPTRGRMVATRFIEEGERALAGLPLHITAHARLETQVQSLLAEASLDRDMLISDARYTFITTLVARCVTRPTRRHSYTCSDQIDLVVTNRFLAIPIFLLLMLSIFQLAFGTVGAFFTEKFAYLLNDVIFSSLATLLKQADASPWAYSLVVDGMLAGVGSVLNFLPQVTILFFMLHILEDSGYMARAAFIMDRFLHRFGLSGRAFIPMLMGFGCSVPALMATRTLEDEKDRRLTMMIIPFMSCQARLPVYAVFAGAFFAANQSVIVFSLYLLGMVVAVLSGVLLKQTILRGGSANFIMELPPYRWPTPKSLLLHTWERVRGFLYKAGTILLAASIIIWFMQRFNFQLQLVDESSHSIFGTLGALLAPIFAPLGFGDWRAAMALLTGLAAKEAVVGTLGILYAGGNATGNAVSLASALPHAFSPLSAYAFLAFTLLYMPCIAAFSTLKREMNSWQWTIGAVAYQTAVAWLVALLIYQIGSLLLALR